MNHAPDSDWLSRFAELADLDAESRRLLESRAKIVEIGAGHTVFAPGKMPEAFLLLLDGAVRVQQVGESGREIVLYRVSGGESCIMTTACLLSDESYQAEGVTETDVRAVALARNDFDDLMARSAGFRRFVFTNYASRMSDILAIVEDVAFHRLDKRLAQKLLDLAADGDSIDITHQRLATELGSAREVVSRLMKEFGRRGWVETRRGQVVIVKRAGLADLAGSGS